MQGEMAALFLRHEGFLGAMGAFLKVHPMTPSSFHASHTKEPRKVLNHTLLPYPCSLSLPPCTSPCLLPMTPTFPQPFAHCTASCCVPVCSLLPVVLLMSNP